MSSRRIVLVGATRVVARIVVHCSATSVMMTMIVDARQCMAMRGVTQQCEQCMTMQALAPPLQNTDRRGTPRGCPHCRTLFCIAPLTGNIRINVAQCTHGPAMFGIAFIVSQCGRPQGSPLRSLPGHGRRCRAMSHMAPHCPIATQHTYQCRAIHPWPIIASDRH